MLSRVAQSLIVNTEWACRLTVPTLSCSSSGRNFIQSARTARSNRGRRRDDASRESSRSSHHPLNVHGRALERRYSHCEPCGDSASRGRTRNRARGAPEVPARSGTDPRRVIAVAQSLRATTMTDRPSLHVLPKSKSHRSDTPFCATNFPRPSTHVANDPVLPRGAIRRTTDETRSHAGLEYERGIVADFIRDG